MKRTLPNPDHVLMHLIYQAWFTDVLQAWVEGHVVINNKIEVRGGWYKPYWFVLFPRKERG